MGRVFLMIMRKVKTTFYCIKTGKKYLKGEDYDGKRKDVNQFLEKPKRKRPKK